MGSKSRIWVKKFDIGSVRCAVCGSSYRYFEDAVRCCSDMKEGLDDICI